MARIQKQISFSPSCASQEKYLYVACRYLNDRLVVYTLVEESLKNVSQISVCLTYRQATKGMEKLDVLRYFITALSYLRYKSRLEEDIQGGKFRGLKEIWQQKRGFVD